MKMEVYTLDEIDFILNQLSMVQDSIEVEDPEILWQMLEEVIEILVQEKQL